MIGIDEAGRGAWAGPLVVAGCYFTENPGFIIGLDDSKKLSRQNREKLELDIKSNTLFHVAIVSASEVDSLGLTIAIKRAILEILDYMPTDEQIMLDGKYNFLIGTKYESRSRVEVAADANHPAVMAASILAKVERDSLMHAYHTKYPEYGFSTNAGYGTKLHRDAVEAYGITDIHRKSIKPLRQYQ